MRCYDIMLSFFLKTVRYLNNLKSNTYDFIKNYLCILSYLFAFHGIFFIMFARLKASKSKTNRL